MFIRLQQFSRRAAQISLSVLAWHGRLLLRLALGLLALMLLLAALWQFWFVPRLDGYSNWVAKEISKAAGLPVSIGHLQGGWHGVRPRLVLKDVEVFDAQKRRGLHLGELNGALSWWYLPVGQLHFSNIRLHEPDLTIVHRADSSWEIGGMAIRNGGASDAGFANWLLAQGGFEIRRAQITLFDEKSAAAPIQLQQLNFTSSNLLGYRRVTFNFLPGNLGGMVEGDGYLLGRRFDDLAQWSGSINLRLPQLTIAPLADATERAIAKAWPESLLIRKGLGSLKMSFSFAQKQIQALNADLDLRDLQLSFHDHAFTLPLLDAGMNWRASSDRDLLHVDLRRLRGDSGEIATNAGVDYNRIRDQYQLVLRNLNLAGFSAYETWLPEPWHQVTAGASMAGQVALLDLGWQGDLQHLTNYRGKVSAQGLDLILPTQGAHLGKLDIEARFDEKSGELTTRSGQVDLTYPEQFFTPLQFQKLLAELSWQRQAQGWDWRVKQFDAANSEAELTFNGRYARNASDVADTILLKGSLSRLSANRVHAYLPRVVGDDTIAWLRDALKAGQAKNAQFEVAGKAADFPYPNGQGGKFLVDFQANGVTLDYAAGWPALQDVSGNVRFENQSMHIRNALARVFDVRLHDVDVQIPDLANDARVIVNGQGEGATQAFARFIKESPIREASSGFLDDLKSEGNGRLGLKLTVPINDPDRTTVAGSYRFDNNRLDFGGGIPALSQATGRVDFTDKSLKIADSTARGLGGPVRLAGGTDPKGRVRLTLAGQAQIAEVAQRYTIPLSKKMSGTVNYQGSVQAGDKDYELLLQSDLQGLRADLPAPLGKVAARAVPFRLRLVGGKDYEQIEFAYDRLLQGKLLDKSKQPLSGGIVLGYATPANNPHGITVSGGWPEFNVASWMALLDSEPSMAADKPPVNELNLVFDRILVAGKQLNQVKLKARELADGRWSVNLDSPAISGEALWRGTGAPQLSVRLSKLSLPFDALVTSAGDAMPTTDLPGVDLVVDNLHYENKELGRLAMDAVQTKDGWAVNQLQLENLDGKVVLSARWNRKTNVSAGKFHITSPSMGKLLARLGYPEAMKNAPATLAGDAQWTGLPFAPELPSLQGQVKLEVGQGSFVKIEPGAGRFLSVISLQALPRRIKLDFSDVFSEGFEFDSIKGDAKIDHGIAQTDNLALEGGSAKVKFTGNANFVAGTQDLRVRIVPEVVGDSVAIAATVVNPIAGAATYLVQKALKNPLAQLVSYDYEITGTMQDPKIKKLGWFGE